MSTVTCDVLDPRLRTLEDVRQNLSGPFCLPCSQVCWASSLLKEQVRQQVGPKHSSLPADVARGGFCFVSCVTDSVRCHQAPEQMGPSSL